MSFVSSHPSSQGNADHVPPATSLTRTLKASSPQSLIPSLRITMASPAGHKVGAPHSACTRSTKPCTRRDMAMRRQSSITRGSRFHRNRTCLSGRLPPSWIAHLRTPTLVPILRHPSTEWPTWRIHMHHHTSPRKIMEIFFRPQTRRPTRRAAFLRLCIRLTLTLTSVACEAVPYEVLLLITDMFYSLG